MDENENDIDFDALTEDEAVELLDELLIDELEETVLEAVGSDANSHLADLEEMQELLSEGEYEMAWDVALKICVEAELNEEQLDELKKGFKFSSSARAKTARFKKKAKTGQARMALKKARKKARKPAEKQKRLRFRKRNKARITRRRKQLGNSIEIDATAVQEMLDAGFSHAVMVEGEDEPTFTRDEESANELVEEIGGEVIDLEEYAPVNGAPTKAAMASAIGAFLQKHPDVTYGELATRFKIGRDVAQQVMLSVGRFTSAYAGGSYSAGDLAKHIMGRLPQQGSVPATGAGGQISAGDDTAPAANLSEDDRASIEQTLAQLRKAGFMKEACLFERTIGLEEGEDEEEPEIEEIEETELDDDDDEVEEGKKGKSKVETDAEDGQRGPKPAYQGQVGAIPDDVQHEDEETDDDELVEVSAPREQAEDLIEAAKEAGLGSDTNIQVRNGRIYMSVPEEAAATIQQRLSA